MKGLQIKTQLSQNHQATQTMKAGGKNKLASAPPLKIRETLNYQNKGSSLSPNKIKRGSSRMFKNARQIQDNQTYLNANKYRLSNTNQSSSPQPSNTKGTKLQRPINCAKNNRSVSTSKVDKQKQMKTIQRTVSILIDGKSKDNKGAQTINGFSLIMLDQQRLQDEFQIQCVEQSSIHGDKSNFFGEDSNFMSYLVNPEQHNSLNKL